MLIWMHSHDISQNHNIGILLKRTHRRRFPDSTPAELGAPGSMVVTCKNREGHGSVRWLQRTSILYFMK
jgi:hypothetical protein